LNCYFQGCNNDGKTREHIPPQSFFPDGERTNLLTVRSCEEHNNKKTKDDLYILAQICMNASPSNRAREVFENSVVPQLSFNNGALRKRLAKGSTKLEHGVKYKVETQRFDDFFTALSCGIIFKSCGSVLPRNYSISHIYHNLIDNEETFFERQFHEKMNQFYSEKPMSLMSFGNPKNENENIYTVTTFGLPNFESSITILHNFFGTFKVTSMLTNTV